MPTIRTFARTLPALALAAGLACTATASASVLSSATGAPAQPANFVKPEDRNAAILYWQHLSTIDRETSEKLRAVDWEKIGDSVDGSVIPAWFTEDTAALHHTADGLVRASRLRKCNFETAYEEGLFALIPHLSPMRNGSRLLRLCARQAAVEGNGARSAEYIAAMVRMGSHAAEEPILIGSLVGMAITNQAMDEAESLLRAGVLDADSRLTIATTLRSLPKDDPGRSRYAITGERDIFLPWMARVSGDPATLREVGEMLSDEQGTGKAEFLALIEQGPEAIGSDLKQAAEAYTQIIGVWGQPDALQQLERINQRVAGGEFGVSAKVLAPSFTRAGETDQKFRTRLTNVIRSLEGQ
ncbi:MAG: hypothetical protein KJZ65_13065 [Phycisphaerales bacterium]|nr:hypothetical protein [Phycisphaerales bacterium]